MVQQTVAEGGNADTVEIGGRVLTLPTGVTAEQARELAARRRSGEQLSAAERALMRRLFQGAGGTPGNGRYQFGGRFWVVAERDGSRVAVPVRTGITDLDRAEIVDGLEEGDTVLLLPSSHLMETQQELQSFITRRIGGVPGIGQRSQ